MCCLLLGTSQDSGLQLQKAPSKIRCWCISVVRSAAKAHQCWLFILNSSNNSVTVSLHTPGFFSEKSALPHLSRLEVLCQAVLLCPVKSSPSNKHSYCQEATLPVAHQVLPQCSSPQSTSAYWSWLLMWGSPLQWNLHLKAVLTLLSCFSNLQFHMPMMPRWTPGPLVLSLPFISLHYNMHAGY